MLGQGRRRVPPPPVPGMRSLTTIRLGDASLLWQAEPESGEPPFAVKLLRPSPDTGRPDEVGLWEEFSATEGVQPLLFSGVTDEGRPYAVTELRPEGDYGQALARGEQLSVDEVVAAGEAVAGALAAMHAAGFLHHAVRPDHILHGEPGPALVDFGSALPLDHPFPPVYYTRRDLHHTPPEELRGEAPSPASDVFRLASTLWTLLDGRPPFDPDADGEEPLSEYRDRILSAAAVGDIRREDVPEWLRAVLRRALDPDPALRTATAEEFAAALAARQAPLGGEAPESADGEGHPEGAGGAAVPESEGAQEAEEAQEVQEPRAATPDADDGYPEEAEGAQGTEEAQEARAAAPDTDNGYPDEVGGATDPEAEGAQGAEEAQEAPEPRAATLGAADGYPDEAETAPLAAATRTEAPARAESDSDPDDGYPDETETAPLAAEERAWWEEDEKPQPLSSPAARADAASRTDSGPDPDDDGYPDDGYPDDDTSTGAGVPGTLRARRAAVLPEADGPGSADQEETEPLGALGTASGPARPDSGTSATGTPRPPAPPRPPAATGPSTAPTAAYSAPAPSTGTKADAPASTTPLSPSTAPAAAHTAPAPRVRPSVSTPAAPAPTAPLSGSPAPTRRDPGPAPAPPFRPSPAPRPAAPPAPAFGTGGPDRFAPPYPDLAPEPPRERRFGALVGPVLVGLLAVVVVAAGITVLVRGMGGDDSPSASPEAGAESSGGPEPGASAPPADDPAVALAPADVALTDDLVAVSLTWTDNTGGESAHVIVGGPADTRGTSMARTEAGESSVEISGLNPEVEYCFQVVAVHSTEVLAPSEEVCTDRADTG
ncbi:protein kinase domain-containing protein [Nocardiopsis changdeensis]|uniref:Serine/threonine protein kinase n=1 Tax=Nocardiopsis changdeensis TaxID=2831969 RepID=A0ABX8BMD1_9ACTN|nr:MULTISPECIES: serine/threonine protein kinase [Nocardiopsis]QUX23229.1 serine/threonine protein kinase [Nocardiopsis changdeensis]QYX39171.1 serine/threonine protein kinase [Nocardiopsis sp. MT53]